MRCMVYGREEGRKPRKRSQESGVGKHESELRERGHDGGKQGGSKAKAGPSTIVEHCFVQLWR